MTNLQFLLPEKSWTLKDNELTLKAERVNTLILAAADLVAAIYDERFGIPFGNMSSEVVGALLLLRESIERLDCDALDAYTRPDGSLGLR